MKGRQGGQPASQVRTHTQGQDAAGPRIDDLAFLNAVEPDAQSDTVRNDVERALHRGDDFVTVPLPRIAMAVSPAMHRVVGEALQAYDAERGVIDERLFQKIDVALKGGDLQALIDRLSQQTGVPFYVSPDLADRKVTVLADATPARDLMRQVARLFDLQWLRYGKEGKYRYQLTESLKQRLAEEERRRRDEDETLLNVAADMAPDPQLEGQSHDEIRALDDVARRNAAATSAAERERWRAQIRKLWLLKDPRNHAAAMLYRLLTPEQQIALRNGQEVTLTYDDAQAENDVPREIVEEWLKGEPSAPPSGNLKLVCHFRLTCDRPDEAGLSVDGAASSETDGRMWTSPIFASVLTQSQSDALRGLDNARDHAALRSRPDYRATIAVHLDPGIDPGAAGDESADADRYGPMFEAPGAKARWTDSAGVLEALHRKTGRPILSDYYLRIYPKSAFDSGNVALLDALNRIGDTLHCTWQEDGAFLRFRRVDDYNERLLDIPNRLLEKWRDAERSRGYLSLEDLAEMAALPVTILKDADLRQAVRWRYGVRDLPVVWMTVKGLRLYGMLTPEQKAVAQTAEGLPLAALSREQILRMRDALEMRPDVTLPELAQGRFHIRLRKPGVYGWENDLGPGAQRRAFPARYDVAAATKEQAEAGVRAALQAILASGAPSEPVIHQEYTTIAGPEPGVVLRLQIGESIVRQDESRRFSRSEWSGPPLFDELIAPGVVRG